MRKHGYLLPIRAEWCAKIFDVQRKIMYDDSDERLKELKIKVAKQVDGAKPPFVL